MNIKIDKNVDSIPSQNNNSISNAKFVSLKWKAWKCKNAEAKSFPTPLKVFENLFLISIYLSKSRWFILRVENCRWFKGAAIVLDIL